MRRLSEHTVRLTASEARQAAAFDALLDEGHGIPVALRLAGIPPSPLALWLAGVGDTMTALTAPCVVCGERSEVVVDSRKWLAWCGPGGIPIQVAFPDMSADEREVLISGTHPACWPLLFADD